MGRDGRLLGIPGKPWHAHPSRPLKSDMLFLRCFPARCAQLAVSNRAPPDHAGQIPCRSAGWTITSRGPTSWGPRLWGPGRGWKGAVCGKATDPTCSLLICPLQTDVPQPNRGKDRKSFPSRASQDEETPGRPSSPSHVLSQTAVCTQQEVNRWEPGQRKPE